MKKIVLPFLVIIILTVLAPAVFASSLKVSKSADFSSDDLNFIGGEKVYVRVESDGSGSSQKTLNIRDNQYNLISGVDLSKSGNTFSASFNAPNTEGYFSLEAVISGDGASSKSVKTIKVGSPGSANIKVNVNSSVKGTNVSKVSEVSNVSKVDEETGKDDQANSVSPSPEVYGSQSDSNDQDKPVKSNWFFAFFKNIFSFLWPFNK